LNEIAYFWTDTRWYAQRFSRRPKRNGHLFQNRYKSFLCEEDPYLLELLRYVHLNPIRAGIINDLSELNEYSLTGYAAIMGESGMSGRIRAMCLACSESE
jgi:hypothetical protein